MDKELLRVVIIATGLLVIIVMLAWHFFKNRKFSQDQGLFSDQEYTGHLNESLVVHTDHDDFDVVPLQRPVPAAEGALQDGFDEDFNLDDDNIEPTPRFVAPEIIQFSIMAKNGGDFNGLDLLKAFQIAQLQYGSLKIFERIDASRMVDFGVACLAGPGTFPSPDDMGAFSCRGIVFFMQPGALEDPAGIFDDFLDAVNVVAVELNGDILDHEKKPLNNATILLLRQSL